MVCFILMYFNLSWTLFCFWQLCFHGRRYRNKNASLPNNLQFTVHVLRFPKYVYSFDKWNNDEEDWVELRTYDMYIVGDGRLECASCRRMDEIIWCITARKNCIWSGIWDFVCGDGIDNNRMVFRLGIKFGIFIGIRNFKFVIFLCRNHYPTCWKQLWYGCCFWHWSSLLPLLFNLCISPCQSQRETKI